MAIVRQALNYSDNRTPFHAALIFDDTSLEPAPGLLVAPTFMGTSDFEIGRCEALAALGYVTLAIDLYGNGRLATGWNDAFGLMAGLLADRRDLQRRMQVALQALKGSERVDASRTAGVGYCLGGKCVLDLARSGADLCGVVSLHGVFDPPPYPSSPITAKILILQGWEDPLTPSPATLALADELTAAGADWQMHHYGHVGHGFAKPGMRNQEGKLLYDEKADRRSWSAMRGFFEEVFGGQPAPGGLRA